MGASEMALPLPPVAGGGGGGNPATAPFTVNGVTSQTVVGDSGLQFGPNGGPVDASITRVGANLLGFPGNTYIGANGIRTYKPVQLQDAGNPATPSAESLAIYGLLNGSDKMELRVKFPGGTTATLATQP